MSEQPRRRRRRQDAIVGFNDEVHGEMSTANITFTSESIQSEESIPPKEVLSAKRSIVETTVKNVDFTERINAKQAYISVFGLDCSNIEKYKKKYMSN